MSFAMTGQAWTPDRFRTFARGYHFGSVPPSYIVLHHSANPAASWATGGLPSTKWWDRNETGLSADQILAKRLQQVAALRDYYQKTLRWSAGPHLFIDDRYIYGMTPMYEVGIHASFGNSFRRGGKLFYSVGIEVVGNYTSVRWPAAVAANVRAAVQILHDQLQTFGLFSLYADGLRPGSRLNAETNLYEPIYPERLRAGGLSSHRDYNKPSCPGAAITDAFYVEVITGQALATAYRVRAGATATVRSGTSRAYPVVRGLPAGSPVAVLETVAGTSYDGESTWARVGDHEYIHMSALERTTA